MTTFFYATSVLIISSALGLAVGCSKKKDSTAKNGTEGQAKVSFTDGTTRSHKIATLANTCPSGTCPTPDMISKFEFKLTHVIMSAPGSTSGAGGAAIFVHPECPSETQSFTEDGVEYTYIGFGVCDDEAITTFLDLKLPHADVNAALNSQYLPIAPGNFSVGSVTFCNDGDMDGTNYKVTMSNDASLPAEIRGATLEVISGVCGFDIPLDPTLDIAEGETVTVNFDYDLTNTVYYRSATASETPDDNCVALGVNPSRYFLCAQPPTFAATFTEDTTR